MKQILHKISLTAVFLLCLVSSHAQAPNVTLRSPFDFGLLLSANFGELRSNHFHAGVDFKTGGVVGRPIRCVADGYICRAKVEAAGYGMALYVMHDSCMTVYAHLDRFPENVAKRVRDCQYEKECFEVDVHFAPGDFPVKRGELLAHAGNTSYSFGPHLHFEVRDTTGNRLYNPMSFYKSKLSDTRPPKATAFVVYPHQSKGMLFGGQASRTFSLKGNVLPDTIEAWGDIAFGVEALDYMDNTSNKYGIYHIRLLADGETIFESWMDSFTFNENKLILACVDKGREKRDEGIFQKLFITPNNPFGELKAGASRGWLSIDEEREYNVECHLSDYHGNTSKYGIVVRGSRCALPQPGKSASRLCWGIDNVLRCRDAVLAIPHGEMFDDACLEISNGAVCDITGYSASTGEDVFFWHGAKLTLSAHSVPVADKSKLYISEITDGDTVWVGGKYENGWVTARIPSQGCYAIASDTVPPVLRPVGEAGWMKNARLVFDLYDNETTVTSFRGTLNGRFVLFKYNRKDKRITFDFKQENIRNGNHKLRVEATDAYGNTAVFEKDIKY